MIPSMAEEATTSQQATMGPAPMEGIERINVVVVRGLGVGAGQNIGVLPRWDPYAMEVDQERNCYACGGFGHMARHCRNQGQRGRVAEGRRLEYKGRGIEGNLKYSNNLKGVENLESLD